MTKTPLCYRLTIIALLLPAVISAAAEEMRVSYEFARPVTETVKIGTVMYDRILLPEAPNGGNIGHPSLPARGARILLPNGTRVKSVQIETGSRTRLGENFLVEPVAQPVALSEAHKGATLPEPDAVTYALDRAIPSRPVENVGVQKFRGFSILILKLHPVQYRPASGELFFYDRLTVVVETEPDVATTGTRRGLARDAEAVLRLIDNPRAVADFTSTAEPALSSYDLLILTTPWLVSGFQPLADYHNATGIATEIHTTGDVGSNNPALVREYIRQEYLSNGIQYVLIGADDDAIPAQNLYVEAWGDGPTVSDLPGDIYFACLDGTFNYDDDVYWGEATDGDGGGDVDLIAEVWVGRAPVDNLTEATRFVNKTLTYLTTADTYLDRVLMAGGQIGLGGLGEYGGDSMDEIIDSSGSHGYYTAGIPSDHFLIDQLYDREDYWSDIEMMARINDGRHIINHYGHSNVDYALKLNIPDVLAGLTNSELCFVYSQGCLAGHFDGMDCFAEAMSIKTNYGAFAMIMNARQGYGTYGTTDGPSQRYNREFWDAVFSPMEGKTRLGPAHHDSKEDNLYRINEACMRWCYYETTLFGDPTVGIRNVRTLAFDYSDSIPFNLPPQVPSTFEVIARGVGEGQPVPGTGRLHLSRNGGPITAHILSETSPNQYLVELPALYCGERLEFYVSAEEATQGRVFETAPSWGHVVHPGGGEVTVFQDDFEADRGWDISGGLWERGAPLGLGGNSGAGPDPAEAHSGTCVFGYNLAGNYEPGLGERYLTSPAIDCSGLSGVRLRFFRWLGLESPPYDHACIRVSHNSEDWSNVWENGSELWDPAWNLVELDISEWADLQPVLYVRFVMGPTDFRLQYCGWNIDDLEVVGFICNDGGDADNDGVLNAVDNCVLVANPDQADADGDQVGDLCDACTDLDGDTYGDPGYSLNTCAEDNCPDVSNPLQEDGDLDTIGDSCDSCTDTDGDGFGNPEFPGNICPVDNCPDDFNPDQLDSDGDGVGDICDGCCLHPTVGDIDQSGGVDITDISVLIDNQFLTLTPLICEEEGDIDFSGTVDITDLSILIDNQFLSLAPLPACP